jgi:transcriptional regulator with XRE-family HTH domain
MEHSMAAGPIDTLARRVRQVRARRELTAQQLADRLRELGVPWDRATVTKLETGRRQNVTLTEWLALARALEVAPVHLLVEPEGPGAAADAAEPYQVTPTETASREDARAWIRGMSSLPQTDLRIFYSEVPAEEWGYSWVLLQQGADPEGRVGELHKWARRGYGGFGNPDVTGKEADGE